MVEQDLPGRRDYHHLDGIEVHRLLIWQGERQQSVGDCLVGGDILPLAAKDFQEQRHGIAARARPTAGLENLDAGRGCHLATGRADYRPPRAAVRRAEWHRCSAPWSTTRTRPQICRALRRVTRLDRSRRGVKRMTCLPSRPYAVPAQRRHASVVPERPPQTTHVHSRFPICRTRVYDGTLEPVGTRRPSRQALEEHRRSSRVPDIRQGPVGGRSDVRYSLHGLT
jgi:hypothetical protein